LGITPLELNIRMKQDRSLDDRLDSTVTRLSRERADDKLIFDSRMAWHFASNVFKIFVTVDPMTAAERVMANPRPEEPYESVEDACTGLIERSRVEQARFLDMYGVDYYDFKNHNLVVDSTRRTPEEIVEIIWEAFLAYQEDPIANAHRECL
jgi:cytidylate kinase